MPLSPLHDELLTNDHASREEHKASFNEHPSLNNNTASPSAADLVDVSGAQVMAASEHGQEIVVKYEDQPWLRAALNVGLPFFNHCVAQTVKQWIEASTGPMNQTNFGNYGDSIYDAAGPAVLTVIEAFFLDAYFKTNKLVVEQGFVAAGAVAAGAAFEGFGVNAKLLSSMSRPYAELLRAGVATFFGWGLKHAGSATVELCTAKKTVVTSQAEEQAEEAPVLSGRRLTTR